MIFGGGSGGAIGTGIVYSLYDNFSTTADKISTKWTKLQGVTNKATAKIQGAMNKMRLGFTAMIAGAVLLAPVLMGVGKSMEFNATMSEVYAKAQVTNIAVQKQLANEAMRLGEATKFSAKQAAEGQVFLAQAGFKVVDIMSAMPGVLNLAAAGNLDLAKSADIASNILTAMGLKATEMTRVADVLALGASSANVSVEMMGDSFSYAAASAKGLGWSLEQTTAMVGMLGNIGIQGSVAGTAIMNFNRFLTKLTPAKMDKIGLSMSEIVDEAGNLKNVETVFATVLDKMKDMGNYAKSGVMAELFGPRGSRPFAAVEAAMKGGDMMDFSEFVENLNNAAGSAERIAKQMMDNLKGDLTILKSVWETTLIKIGDSTEDALRPMVQGLIKVISFFGTLINTPVGKWIVRLTAAVGGLALALGLVIVVTNLATLASGKAAIAFASMGKTQIAAAFTTKGLRGGIRELFVSLTKVEIKTKTFGKNIFRLKFHFKNLYKSIIKTRFSLRKLSTGFISLTKKMFNAGRIVGKLMVQFLPMIAIGAIFSIFTKAVTAFDDVLNGTTESAQGFLGFLQKFGGIMKAVTSIWKSANNEGFTMSEQLAAALDKLGILPMAIAIGTWIVRLKAFFRGIGDGIKSAWNVIKPIFKLIGAGIDWLSNIFSKFGSDMDKNISPLDTWAIYGKALGIIIMSILVPAFISMAISVIAATWPILIIIAAIVGVIALIKNWGAIMEWFGKIFGQVWDWIVKQFTRFMDWSNRIDEKFKNWGKNLIGKLKEGIKSAWQNFKDWLSSLVDGLLAPIKKTLAFFGFGDAESNINVEGAVGMSGEEMAGMTELAVANGESRAMTYNVPPPTVLQNNQTTEVIKTVNIDMDGSQIRGQIDIGTNEDLERQ